MVYDKSTSENRKIIRDSIHGDIFLKELDIQIVDTPEFQRLRRIRQLGMTHLVYPGANHTRFEHSLGAFHLAGRIAENLPITPEEKTMVTSSALLHDIGHGPLSHTSEELLERYLGKSHVEVTNSIISSSEIGNILKEWGIETRHITQMITGESQPLGKIVSGEVDIDRMDFLVRDAHYTGVAYGVIDLDRIINTTTIFNNSLVVAEGGLRAVEALLMARFLMTPTVYLHPASRVADAMFLRATERAIEKGSLDYNVLYKMDDYDIQNMFKDSTDYVHDIGVMLEKRQLFKKFLVMSWNDLDDESITELIKLRNNLKRWRRIESEMAEACKIDEGYIILDIPKMPSYGDGNVSILKDGKVQGLEDMSPLVKILKEAHKNQWSIGVYTPKDNIDKASKKLADLDNYLR